jgi:hypothetical protein
LTCSIEKKGALAKASEKSSRKRLAPMAGAPRAAPARQLKSPRPTTASITVVMRDPMRPPTPITSEPASMPASITARTTPRSWGLPVRAST